MRARLLAWIGGALLLALPTAAHAEGGHTAESAIPVPQGGTLGKVRVWFDVDHAYPSDLVFTLRHESEAGTVEEELLHRPHTGHELEQAVSSEAFRGTDAAGTWTLVVADHGAADTGELTGWTLMLDRCDATGTNCRAVTYRGPSAEIPDGVTLEAVFTSWEFWSALANFSGLVFILYWFGRRPMNSYLVARRKTVEEDLLEAQRLKEAAQTKYDEYSSRLEKLDHEIESLRAEMIKAGEEERDRIVSEAEAKAARMRRETEFVIDQQLKQLKVDLTREAVEAAVGAAESLLSERITAADQDRLAKEYLARLQQTEGLS